MGICVVYLMYCEGGTKLCRSFKRPFSRIHTPFNWDRTKAEHVKNFSAPKERQKKKNIYKANCSEVKQDQR